MSDKVQSSGWFSDLISGLVFYGVILPTGQLRRLIKLLWPRAPGDTFWVTRRPGKDANSMTHQY
jgi:hypothetical protein